MNHSGYVKFWVPVCILWRSRYLVAAGDPCQLPPLVASPSAVEQKPGQPARFGLARPLFARLVAMGYPSHLLRNQYRQGTGPHFHSCPQRDKQNGSCRPGEESRDLVLFHFDSQNQKSDIAGTRMTYCCMRLLVALQVPPNPFGCAQPAVLRRAATGRLLCGAAEAAGLGCSRAALPQRARQLPGRCPFPGLSMT